MLYLSHLSVCPSPLCLFFAVPRVELSSVIVVFPGLTLSFIFEPWHRISNNVVCATSKGSDQPAHTRSLIIAFARRLNILSVKLLTEHNLEFSSLKGGCTGSPESTFVKMTHRWKSHVTAHLLYDEGTTLLFVCFSRNRAIVTV